MTIVMMNIDLWVEMQIFKIKKFNRWQKNQMLSDKFLNKTVKEINEAIKNGKLIKIKEVN